MQRAELRARVGAQPVGQQRAQRLVGGQGLGGAPRVAQGAQPQDVQGLVQGMEVAQGGELGQGLFGVPERQGRAEAGAAHVEAAGLPAGRLGGAVREVGQGRPVPQREGVVEDHGRLRRVAVGERPCALTREPLETVQVDVVRGRDEPVAPAHRVHRARAERPAQPPDQRLQRRGRVGGRVGVPHLVDQDGGGHGPARPQREHGQQGTQARPADRDGRAVGAECLGGSEDAVAHGVHCLR